MRAHVARKGKAWYVVVEEGQGPDGKRRRSWHSGFRTRKEAEAGLSKLLAALEGGTYAAPTRATVEDFLVGEWLPAVRAEVRPGTWNLHRINVEAYIVPKVGHLRLQDLSPAHLNRLYAELLERLAPKTTRNVHGTVSRALGDAVRWGRLGRNVASLANPPRVPDPETPSWAAEELAAFLAHVREDRLYAAWTVLATTGLRRGELLGLGWEHIDGDRLEIRRALVLVAGEPTFTEPKTRKGRRSVPVPPQTVAALREHRKRQAEERLAWGPAYQDHGLVFTREDGTPLHPERLADAFGRHVKAAALPRLTLHGLRHTYATLALRAGVHPKVVQEVLGHANIGITLDRYSHAVPALEQEAAVKVAALIFPGGR
jgi:integrase